MAVWSTNGLQADSTLVCYQEELNVCDSYIHERPQLSQTVSLLALKFAQIKLFVRDNSYVRFYFPYVLRDCLMK